MGKVYQWFRLASVCMAFVLAGCVPLQPPPPATGAQEPISSAQDSSQAAPDPTPTAAPGVSTDWQVFVDTARRLEISYPPGWLFVDPTTQELTDLLAKADEQAASDEIREQLATLTSAMQQADLFVGIGLQVDPDSISAQPYLNNISAVTVPFEGLDLYRMTRMIATQLGGVDGIDVERAEVVAGLRPGGEETPSIRYRADGALYNRPDRNIVGWQVGVLAPDTETILILTFSIISEEFAELEPLLREMVQRVQWTE